MMNCLHSQPLNYYLKSLENNRPKIILRSAVLPYHKIH